MKNTFGQSVTVTLFGESHGAQIGAVLDGMAPGLFVDEDFIRHQLSLRRPRGKISTSRVEADEFRIVSGLFEGRTTGTPLCILIPNTNTRSGDYERGLPRPGHADYTAQCKYHGFQDYRGGGHFSGRVTAALVAVGAIAISALRQNGILLGTHISRLASVSDRAFGHYEADLETLGDLAFPVLDPMAGDRMRERIESAASEGDSVGGVLETAVIGLPAGIGEPWFDTVEGVLSHALFSIPGIKGVEFGDGFALADMKGSEANDGFRAVDGRIVTTTNHNGGINGGITNGMPVVFRTAVKPTPSIFRQQESVDLETGKNALLTLEGRHDPAIIHRARVVVDSVTALVLCDLLALRFGTDFADTH
ncbi:MAG: chorismate synthase [Ruminococcaceae bacterium]|nr:chorismate synthase [Oscillospiraceae bacterium]